MGEQKKDRHPNGCLRGVYPRRRTTKNSVSFVMSSGKSFKSSYTSVSPYCSPACFEHKTIVVRGSSLVASCLAANAVSGVSTVTGNL